MLAAGAHTRHTENRRVVHMSWERDGSHMAMQMRERPKTHSISKLMSSSGPRIQFETLTGSNCPSNLRISCTIAGISTTLLA